MRVRSEKCQGRPLPAYKVAQVPKKLMSGGGGGGGNPTFFDLKIFASILQAHSRVTAASPTASGGVNSRGTLRTSQTSDKQKKKKKKILGPIFFFGGGGGA